MKALKLGIITGVVLIGMAVQGCDALLDEDPVSLLAPENFLAEEQGVLSVLYGAYRHLANSTGNNRGEIGITEYNTDILTQHSGGEHRTATQYTNFTLGPEIGILQGVLWTPNYNAIRNSNIVLENVGIGSYSEAKKTLFAAEARFIRAVAYYKMYRAFGPVPLRTSTTQEIELPRASEEEMRAFIESELLAIIPDLPAPGTEPIYGRAHSGAARAFLTKFYLNTHQWQKSADVAKQLMDLGYYSLYPSYPDLFKVENEMNREFIWVDQLTASNELNSNTWITACFPPGFAKAAPEFFAKTNDEGFEWTDKWRRIASQYVLYDAFVNSFEPEDERQELILVKYLNQNGDTIQLLGKDDSRPFKYWPDPNGFEQAHGNDLPQVRYADILLARAEALNELQGPGGEAVALVNQVRNRAGLPALSGGALASREALREHILKERGWEFWAEGLRRFDLIRMGVYIEDARARGITNAQPYHVRFPIPQNAIDANPLLEQNPGY